MSDENVETWKRLIAAFNERGVDGALEFFAADAEVYDPNLPPDTPTRGHEAVRHVIEQLKSGFLEMQVSEAEFIPAGDRVVGLIDAGGPGVGTRGEMEVNFQSAHIMTFRDGQVVYWRLYDDQDEALSDAGVERRAGAGDTD